MGHSMMTHGHRMCREETAMYRTYREPLTVKYLLVQCRNNIVPGRENYIDIGINVNDNCFHVLLCDYM